MFCHVAQRSYADFIGNIEHAALKDNMPYIGSLELTYRCNLACGHCYCNLPASDESKYTEFSTAQWRRVLDEASDAGCLWLLLTGGEVMMRPDLWDIHEHAIKRGMLVEVFTNGTLIDDTAARRFSDAPPVGIDISIYGSNPAVHDGVTRVKGSFDRTLSGIELLKKHKVGFSLKTMVLSVNLQDLENIRDMAKDLGVEHRFDTVLTARIDGKNDPDNLRLTAEEMASLDLEKDFESCDEIFKGFWSRPYGEDLACGAGVFAFNVSPYGILSPCTMYKSFQHAISDVPFRDAWKALIDEYLPRRREITPHKCISCSMVYICSQCPAAAEAATGKPDEVVGHLCRYAKRLEMEYFRKRGAKDAKETVSETGDQGS
jgi:radical SAM protein with 4Fe4S-binding SPASM domain